MHGTLSVSRSCFCTVAKAVKVLCADVVIGTHSNSTIDSHSNDVNVSQSSNPDYSYNDLYFVTLLCRYFCKWHVF